MGKSILSLCVKSKLEFNVSVNVLSAPLSVPEGLIAFATPFSSLIPNPGLLSTRCSPGNNNIVVFSTISLSFPRR